MLPEYDFRGGVRGSIADRSTSDERGEFMTRVAGETQTAAHNKQLVNAGMSIDELIRVNRDIIRCIAEQHGARKCAPLRVRRTW